MHNTRKNRLLLCLLSFSFYGLRAQTDLQGKVENRFSDVSGIHVINKTSESATITDAKGYFNIRVQEGDTLLFSAVQFRKEEVVVTTEMLNAHPFIVQLREQVTQLDEVVLKNLTGNLTTDLHKIKTDSVDAVNLGLPNAMKVLPSKTQRKLIEATSGGGLIPIIPIINAITGRTKKLKKRVQLEKDAAKTEEIREALKSHTFTSLGIPEDKIYDFLFYCAEQENYDRLKNSNDFISLTDTLKVMAEQYIKVNALAPLKH